MKNMQIWGPISQCCWKLNKFINEKQIQITLFFKIFTFDVLAFFVVFIFKFDKEGSGR